MKLLKDLTKPDFEWEVPSKSEPGTFHKVSFSERDGWSCDCIAFGMSKKPKSCKHIKLLEKDMEDNIIRFDGYNIMHQYLKSDRSIRILIDISKDQLDNVKDILLQKIPDGIFEITIKPKIEE